MPPSSTPESLHAVLLSLGRRMKRTALLQGIATWLGLLLSAWLGVFLADHLFRLPAALRLPLSATTLLFTVWSGWRHVGQLLFRTVTPERTARELELRCGVDDNLLINACQLERQGPPEWTRNLIVSARSQAAALQPESVLRTQALRQGIRMAAGAGLLWILYAGIWTEQVGNAWARLSNPLRDTPPLGRVQLQVSPSGDWTLFEGDSLRIEAIVTGDLHHEGPPVLRRGGPGRSMRNALEEIMKAEQPALPHVSRNSARYHTQIRNVRESFQFQVVCGGTWSVPTRVRVRTLPRIRESSFHVTPPAYTGRDPYDLPGMPLPLAGPRGSGLQARVRLDAPVRQLHWRLGDRRIPLTERHGEWRGSAELSDDGSYSLEAEMDGSEQPFVLAEAAVFARPDTPPRVRFLGQEENRFAHLGESLPLEVEASDDFGLRELRVERRTAGSGSPDGDILQHWQYPGPPGREGEVRERWTLHLHPAMFQPGQSYRIEARAGDFNPEGSLSRSKPIVLRILDPRTAEKGQDPDPVPDALAQAVDAQRKALGLTRNLMLHREEAVASQTLGRHRQSMHQQQESAREHAGQARKALSAGPRTGDTLRLEVLVRHEMRWALESIESLETLSTDRLADSLSALAERQFHILQELLLLLGRTRSRRSTEAQAGVSPPPPAATLRDAAALLHDQLQDAVELQKRILRETLPLADKGPEDLTEDEEAILGRLAREEARLAAFLKDAIDDFSKLPLQDFADGSLADEFHAVHQDVEKAAEALYEKNLELAVPLEQSGLEMALELLHNLEKWLPDQPDHLKWLMEEPPDMPLPPMAELPLELEDIVGALLDDELSMGEEIEDVTSSWIDSLDKGAGWDVADGPISDMSAKAVTGNLLPNEMEIGGRAGEGRSGRSHGQMVESEAEGKGGRQTPTRLTPSPFEPGSVADRSEEDPGGATGGGKLSGFAGEGLRGPSPPPRLERMARLAGRQAEIRQNAERLQLHLRSWQVPTGDLDKAVEAMRQMEEAGRTGHAARIRQAYDETVDSMRQARSTVRTEARIRRENTPLSRQHALDLWTTLREELPPGYEEMAATYFRRLASELAESQD